MQQKRVTFGGLALPLMLLAPQLAITFVFFIWPASQAIYGSVLREDAFGITRTFVGLLNFQRLFADPLYINAVYVTVVFSLGTALMAMGLALLFAVAADKAIKAATTYKTLIIWPYAVAPVLAGVLWWLMFNPSIGIIAYTLRSLGISWNHLLNGDQALILIIIAAAWKQISYNFLFFLAGLQSIPRSLIESAAIDGAGPIKRFFTITLPLLSPTTFFLLVINIVYAFFDTFGIVHATTQGGPGQATTILVYKVYRDGFIGLNLGSSSAQSVILMAVVISLTIVQFRFIERRVHYA
jgi:sn-glycerol 3-phosphate transport system permease protein